jgi:hypothetical protein
VSRRDRLGQVTPFVFDVIHWRYCYFVSSSVECALLFIFDETNQLTLESVAGKFGDDTVSTDKVAAAMGVGDHGTEAKNVAGSIVEQEELT